MSNGKLSIPFTQKTLYTTNISHKFTTHHYLTAKKPFKIKNVYLGIILSSLLSALVFSNTNLATNIMENSRNRVAKAYAALKGDDRSFLSFSLMHGLTVYLKDPQNRLLGDTSDGLRYLQIEGGRVTTSLIENPAELLSSKSLTRWVMQLKKPTEGEYLLTFEAKIPGPYNYSIILTGMEGQSTLRFDGTIYFPDLKPQKRILNLQKYPISNSRLY